MKRIISVVLLAIATLLFQNCRPTLMIYHSEAGIPYKDSLTKTKLKIINTKKEFNFFTIAAIDNDTLQYVLLSPQVSSISTSKPTLEDVNLNLTVVMKPQQVKKILVLLDTLVENWNKRQNNTNGELYEFMVAPEQNIIKESANVVGWLPTLSFYSQNNSKGTLAFLFLGRGVFSTMTTFESVLDIQAFAEKLKIALEGV